MSPWEIVLIVLCVSFVGAVVIGSIVKKKRAKAKGVPACCCDCSSCSHCNGHCSGRSAKEIVKSIKTTDQKTSLH